jgi:hypothetical protein
MRNAHWPKTAGRIAAALSATVTLLTTNVGTAGADFEQPQVFSASNTPNCISVNWNHSGSGVANFSVERDQPSQQWAPIDAAQREYFVCGMDPSTSYVFHVCAYFITEEGDSACGEAVLRTADPARPTGSQDGPAPRIVDLPVGPTFIGVKWDSAGYDYDKYFINYTLKTDPPSGPTTLHQGGGTWGYQRIDGLMPSRTYILQVQGCIKTLLGIGSDKCLDWSAPVEATTLAYPLDYGPDTCAPGFVWRDAFDGDHVCVTPQRRDQVAADNRQASNRTEACAVNDQEAAQGLPYCSFAGPAYCKQGWVWREANPADHVCVTPAERDTVRNENATAEQRYADPSHP